MLKEFADTGLAEAFLAVLQEAMHTVDGPIAKVLGAVLDGETSLRIEVRRSKKGPKGSQLVDTTGSVPMRRDAVAWAVFRELEYPDLAHRLPKGALKAACNKVADLFKVDYDDARACWEVARKDIPQWEATKVGALLDRMIDRKIKDLFPDH